MKALRHGALLAALLAGVAFTLRGADRVGPEPGEVIFPRGSDAAANTVAPPATESAMAAGLPSRPSTDGLLPVAGYLVVLVVLVAGAWILLRRGALPRPFSRSDGRLRVLETRLLGNRQFLVVVEYEDAKMLLGVCPGRIDYLTPLAGDPLAAAVAPDDEDVDPEVAGVVAGSRR
jgi:flagellar biosynthetic protein FliO